ncbi:hypothetical protein SAMN04488033_104118 [Salegentibacter agarivorans]|uniref:Uncharacterized protein n=1 Tax=Salegentibacter agarivorans TaxID=345907 RepID=A0A1I2KRD6_9FLAO|nr:DUF6520 family protein [Salegentibacter agarivorans]SFF68800.1 hypothetical protein SAMN04488033_104118 [Salegentibacter agarivorans]
MKSKVFLPLIAVICAIGMAFATADTNYSAAIGFIETDEGWEQVNVDCEEGVNTCKAYYSSDPNTVYTVYPTDNNQMEPLSSASLIPVEISE